MPFPWEPLIGLDELREVNKNLLEPDWRMWPQTTSDPVRNIDVFSAE
jgi:hypothetical protein